MPPGTRIIKLDELRYNYAMWAIARCKGDQDKAANRLGISRRTFYNLSNDAKKYGWKSWWVLSLSATSLSRCPKIGDIVVYAQDGEQYPAIVAGVYAPGDPRSDISLTAFLPDPLPLRRVSYSPMPEARKWSWREPPAT